ncbi:MAG: hypothetical protein QFB86_00430 [Patescibacteria group bacterium]|nr:hypothetical protein [Patescibacteria group bacterium]
MEGSEKNLYEKVVVVTHVYLGPAADRFIDRQVENHLQKKPASITALDLYKLIPWIQAAVSVITDDTGIIEEYTARLTKLAQIPSEGDTR